MLLHGCSFNGLGDSTGQPSAPVAEIVGVLKNLKDQLSSDLESSTSAEQSAAQGFADLKAAKVQEIKTSSDAIITKEKRSGELALSISQNKDALEDAKDELADAQTYLADLTKECAARAAEYENNQVIRAGEVEALMKAMKFRSRLVLL